jgi:hypothetical protein
VAATEDPPEAKRETYGQGEVTLARLLMTLLFAGVMIGIVYLFAWLWGGIGLFIALGLCLTLALLFARRITG